MSGGAEFARDPSAALARVPGSSVGAEPPVSVPAAGTDDRVTRLHRELALWESGRMREVRHTIEQAAVTDVTVLVTGDTGTGKEVVARAVHELSARRAGPFVKVNCAAVARELLESEMFGHERGAFTGAHERKIGKFEAANHGTIFLDEIGDLHAALQGKLLHVLEDGQFSRVGGRATIKVNVRVVAATNQNLERAVAADEFREDLFYRLNVVRIAVPPLRQRPEEIPLLAEYFVRRYAALFGRDAFVLPAETLDRLARYSFPGNVRELENIVKRMIVLDDPHLARWSVQSAVPAASNGQASASRPSPGSLKTISRSAAQAAEREAILRALERTRWNRVQAARVLGISYRSLLYKIKDAGLGGERHPQEHA